MQDMWLDTLSVSEQLTAAGQRAQGWGFVAPALLWTFAFFIVPFIVMGAMSLATFDGRTLIWGLSLQNYAELAEKPFFGARSSFRSKSH